MVASVADGTPIGRSLPGIARLAIRTIESRTIESESPVVAVSPPVRLPSASLPLRTADRRSSPRTGRFVLGCIAAGAVAGWLVTDTFRNGWPPDPASPVSPAGATAFSPDDALSLALLAPAGLVPIEPAYPRTDALATSGTPIAAADQPAAAAAADASPPPAERAIAAADADPPAAATSAPILASTEAPVAPATPERLIDAPTLVARGNELLASSDVTSARLFYRLAAEAGSPAAALAMAGSFDPDTLRDRGVRGVAGEPKDAVDWYRRAIALGEDGARVPLERLLAAQRREAAQGWQQP